MKKMYYKFYYSGFLPDTIAVILLMLLMLSISIIFYVQAYTGTFNEELGLRLIKITKIASIIVILLILIDFITLFVSAAKNKINKLNSIFMVSSTYYGYTISQFIKGQGDKPCEILTSKNIKDFLNGLPKGNYRFTTHDRVIEKIERNMPRNIKIIDKKYLYSKKSGSVKRRFRKRNSCKQCHNVTKCPFCNNFDEIYDFYGIKMNVR